MQRTHYLFLRILFHAKWLLIKQITYHLWLYYRDKTLFQISRDTNGWNFNEEFPNGWFTAPGGFMVVSVWFRALQFPLSLIKKKCKTKKKMPIDS